MKVNWTAFALAVGAGIVGAIVLRTAEAAFPVVTNVTRLPEKLAAKIVG